MPNDDVVLRQEGALGRITLNRPEVLNALTGEMCARMLAQLKDWARDSDISAVLVDARPGRAFCAGGDIRAIYESGKKRDGMAAEFFETEYQLNVAIQHFPKPYVAAIDGFAFGGGAGISIHGAYRVAGENALFAMPETAIGIFPDIGASYFLPRLPGRIGLYLGLTGARIGPADMIYAGLATHFIPAACISEISPRLADGEPAAAVLASLSTDPGPSVLAGLRLAIDRTFGAGSVEEILTALEGEGEWGWATTKTLARCSPTSLKLTFHVLREGMGRDLESCLRMEYRLALRILEGHDFYEGVRAALIDKDRKPRWRPSCLDAVTEDEITRYFVPLGPRDWTI